MKIRAPVVPAKAGTHVRWIPAFAGMTHIGFAYPITSPPLTLITAPVM